MLAPRQTHPQGRASIQGDDEEGCSEHGQQGDPPAAGSRCCLACDSFATALATSISRLAGSVGTGSASNAIVMGC